MEIEYNPLTGPTSITPTKYKYKGKTFYGLRLGPGAYALHMYPWISFRSSPKKK